MLLATRNRGKINEYRSLLEGIPYELVTPDDVGVAAIVEETGESLEANARLKAAALARESRLLSLADDSGLEVDALGGEPGYLSARYGGKGSDAERVEYLLSRLKGIPWERRTARFRCVIAIAKPDGRVELCSGECAGYIALAPKGEGGFGYDPVFYLPDLEKTMAELPAELKNRISHRGRAARKARLLLERVAEEGGCP